MKRILIAGFVAVLPILAKEPLSELSFTASDHLEHKGKPSLTFGELTSETKPGVAEWQADAAAGSNLVGFAASLFTAHESTGNGTVVVRREGDLSQTVSLSVQTLEGSATSGLDYLALPEEVTFEAGETEKTIEVTIPADSLKEAREEFSILLTTTAPGVFINQGNALLRIQDRQTPGTRDARQMFATAESRAMAVQHDGKILSGYRYVVRMFPDGEIDPTFQTNGFVLESTTGSIAGITPLPNGQMYVWGKFSYKSGSATLNYLARLNADGSLDTTFNSALRLEFSGSGILAVEPVPEGVWVLQKGTRTERELARLGPDGQHNTVGSTHVYNPWTFDGMDLATGPNGYLYVAGTAGQFPHSILAVKTPMPASTPKTDPNFAPPLIGTAWAIENIGDALLVGGALTNTVTSEPVFLARIGFDGTLDESFALTVDAPVRKIHRLEGGRVLIAGNFTNVNGLARQGLARLNEDGTIDDSFHAGSGPNAVPEAIGQLTDGTILLSGLEHDLYDYEPVQGVIRLLDVEQPGTLRFSQDTFWVAEDEAEVSVAVERVGGAEGALGASVVTMPGGARAGTEFEHLEATVNFEDQDLRQKTVTVSILSDPALTGTRSFATRLYDEGGEFLDQATVLISDREDGTVDPSYAPRPSEAGASWSYEPLVAPDGSVFLPSTSGMLKWNPDGSLDESFELPNVEGSNGKTLALQPDGKLVVGDHALVRFRVDLEVDLPFSTNTSPLTYPPVWIRPVPGGDLVMVVNNQLHRLDTNGLNVGKILPLPLPFPASDTSALGLANRDVLVGSFGSEGTPVLFRISPEGEIIEGFPLLSGAGYTRILALAELPDERILVGGSFEEIDGLKRHGIARLFADGRIDPAFDAGVIGHPSLDETRIYAIELLPGGDIVIAGKFDSVQGLPIRHLARLAPDGTVRAHWNPEVQGSPIMSMKFLNTGELAIYGGITNIGGMEVDRFARIRLADAVAPSATILTPENNANFSLGESVPVQIEGYDADGVLGHVTLFRDGVVEAEWERPPYTTALTLEPGTHRFEAEATDLAGFASRSEEIVITVGEEAGPMRIGLIATTEAGWEITVPSTPGRAYRLQTSSDLVTWNDGPEVSASGTVVGFPISADSGGHLFYRVMERE